MTVAGAIAAMNARAARVARHRWAYIFDVRTFSPLPPRTVYQKSPVLFSLWTGHHVVADDFCRGAHEWVSGAFFT